MVGTVVVAHVIGDVAAAAVVRAGECDKSRKLGGNFEVLRRSRTRGGDVNEENVVLEGTVLRWSAFGQTSSASDD